MYNSTIKIKVKECKSCQEERKIFARGLCGQCYQREQQEKQREKAKTKDKKIHKIPFRSKKGMKTANEDSRFFRSIWKARPHQSEISGEHLGDDFNPVFMSHVLTKASYPKFRHKKDNIILTTFSEHQEWEFGDRTKEAFKVKFDKALQRAGKLIIEYYKS